MKKYLSFTSIKKKFAHMKGKDVGISHERTVHSWYRALGMGMLLTCATASIAAYVFITSQESDVVITEPIPATTYKSDEVKRVLERFGERRETYRKQLESFVLTPKVPLTPEVAEKKGEKSAEPPVAESASPRVE
jgi:hypothetical protein